MTAPVHHLEMHADRGEITLRLTCTATPDATCRRRPTNPDAETWTDDDETTPGHDCWAVEWLDNGGWDSITWGPETGTIASVPVDVSYDHRGVLAEPVTLPDPADLLPVTADGTDEAYPLDLMTATPSDYLYAVRDTADRAADALREQIDAAQKVLDSLTRIANDAQDAAQLVAASDIEPHATALVPERSGLIRKEDA